MSRQRLKSNIAHLRKKAGLTQAQLAVLIGVTSNTIQNWEKDSGLDQIEKYIKLCKILRCNLSDLIDYVQVPEAEAPKSEKFSPEVLDDLLEHWDLATKSLAPNSQPDSKEGKANKS